MLSNNISTSYFLWEEFDFHLCDNFPLSRYVWATATLISFVLGFPISVANLWEMYKAHRNGAPFTPNSFFVLNLSIMDAIFLAVIPPGILNHLIWRVWPIEAFWNGVYAFNLCGRPLLMACSCLDCYLAVVHPVTYHNMRSLTPRILIVVVVWIWTLSFAATYFIFYSFFFSLWSILSFVIAIVIVGICDTFIFYTLLTSPHRKNLQKQRAIQMIINSLVITAFTYLPPVILITIGIYAIEYVTFVCLIAIPINILSTLGSVLLPILHFINTGKCKCFRWGNFCQTLEKWNSPKIIIKYVVWCHMFSSSWVYLFKAVPVFVIYINLFSVIAKVKLSTKVDNVSIKNFRLIVCSLNVSYCIHMVIVQIKLNEAGDFLTEHFIRKTEINKAWNPLCQTFHNIDLHWVGHMQWVITHVNPEGQQIIFHDSRIYSFVY